jgi:antitoxin component of MazEF toxin-antitoxin module
MLKKLVKYGNSNALILDRAIMELLNIHEGSVVKLQTDGKALIITPAETEKPVNITLNGLETLINIGAEKQAELKSDPEKKRLLEEWAPGTENFSRMMEIAGPITTKYMKDLTKMHSEEVTAQVDALAIKHHGDRSSEEFMKGYKALRDKYVPTYRDMVQEMREAYKKAGYPEELISESDWE